MSYFKTVPGCSRAGVEILCGRFNVVSNRRCRSTVAPVGTDTGRVDTGEETRSRCAQSKSSSKIVVDFEQTQEAYKSKSSLEILRSMVVFKLCTFDILVDKNKELMDLSRKVLGQKAFEKFMKMTFYGQFVAGEDHESIGPLIQKNQAYGVGAVLDYSVEEDISQEAASSVSMAPKENVGPGHEENPLEDQQQVEDRQGGGVSAHSYVYSEEGKCDRHMETFLKCIQASGGNSMDGFSAIKMTALGRPQFLLQLSEMLVKWRSFFDFLALQQGKGQLEALEQRLDLGQLQGFLTQLGATGDYKGWFDTQNPGSSGTIDVLDWNILMNDRIQTSDLLLVPNIQTGQLEPLLREFSEEEEEQMKRILQRMALLAKHAEDHGVRLMVDAEQTYFQPAISRLTLGMQRVFNKDKPVIFNTYQCYLKEAYNSVSMDMELSRREAWCFGAKLVRGAYMYQERSRAQELGYQDPINPDYQLTNLMYHRCLDHVLDEVGLHRKANVMVASHNEDTVMHTIRRMEELGLSPTENKVYFGQLLGMCDQISFPLGQAGFPVYKYVPYGPVNEVIPYLSRRAQENRGFMKGSQRERELLWKELKRRLASGELFHTPAF